MIGADVAVPSETREPMRKGDRPTKPLKVAFLVEGGRDWIAGLNYMSNVLNAVRTVDQDSDYQLHVVLPERLDEEECRALVSLSDGIIRRQEPPHRYRRMNLKLKKRFWFMKNPPEIEPPLGPQLRRQGIDCVFGIESFGPRFGIPLISWLYDFQHKDLPENFSVHDRKLRDLLFGRVAQYSDRIVVSSQHARSVYCKHYTNEEKVRVLPFAVKVDNKLFERNPESVLKAHDLPERFFFLPNQFWKHKNHELAFKALEIATKQEPGIRLVCSGAKIEPRDPLHVPKLMQMIAAGGLEDNVRILSLIPYEDVIQLVRQSLAVIQPSLYEGWSTTVEECKSLAKPILLSRIDVHEEQSPEFATYVDKNDPRELAEALIRLWRTGNHGPNEILEAKGRIDATARMKSFGRQFLNVVDEVTSSSVVRDNVRG